MGAKVMRRQWERDGWERVEVLTSPIHCVSPGTKHVDRWWSGLRFRCFTGFWLDSHLHQISLVPDLHQHVHIYEYSVNTNNSHRVAACLSFLYTMSMSYVQAPVCAEFTLPLHLHWLLVKFPISYKQLLLTYKSLHAPVPQYLSNPLHICTSSRTLCSSDTGPLSIPTEDFQWHPQCSRPHSLEILKWIVRC